MYQDQYNRLAHVYDEVTQQLRKFISILAAHLKSAPTSLFDSEDRPWPKALLNHNVQYIRLALHFVCPRWFKNLLSGSMLSAQQLQRLHKIIDCYMKVSYVEDRLQILS